MFETARALIEEYYCILLKHGMSRRAEHFLHEIRGRLRQLEWIFNRMVSLEENLVKEAKLDRPTDSQKPSTIKLVFTDASRPNCDDEIHSRVPATPSDELRVLLEAFYYSAHRIRDILRESGDDLPGTKAFEAVGVRNVRNHLVQHPSGKSGVLVFSFAAGGPVGPQLKPLRWSLDAPGTQDEGLYKNTEEFLQSLETTLKKAISGGAV